MSCDKSKKAKGVIVESKIDKISINDEGKFSQTALRLFDDVKLGFCLDISEKIEQKIPSIVVKFSSNIWPFLDEFSDDVDQYDFKFHFLVLILQKMLD